MDGCPHWHLHCSAGHHALADIPICRLSSRICLIFPDYYPRPIRGPYHQAIPSWPNPGSRQTQKPPLRACFCLENLASCSISLRSGHPGALTLIFQVPPWIESCRNAPPAPSMHPSMHQVCGVFPWANADNLLSRPAPVATMVDPVFFRACPHSGLCSLGTQANPRSGAPADPKTCALAHVLFPMLPHYVVWPSRKAALPHCVAGLWRALETHAWGCWVFHPGMAVFGPLPARGAGYPAFGGAW